MMRGHPAGYTLIELVVVVAMLGTMMGFAAPRIAGQLFTSEADEVENWLKTETARLREDAQKNQATLVLRIDVNGRQFFIEKKGAPSFESDTEPQAALILPDGLYINQVLLGQGGFPANNQARIRFFPDGTADPAVLQMSRDNGQRFAWIIEPFLTTIGKMEEHGRYEEYWQ